MLRFAEGGKLNAVTTFPYEPLDRSLDLIDHLYNTHGTECPVDALAESLGTSPLSGSFRVRVSAARKFGLLARQPNVAKLTDTGRRALNPSRRDEALVEAFLHVPLYKQLYNKFHDTPLPEPAGLDSQMIELGVPEKSADRVRRAFLKSATTAGLFDASHNRLVKPTNTQDASDPVDDAVPESASKRDSPILIAIWDDRPAEGCTRGELQEWFDILQQAFKWVYQPQLAVPTLDETGNEAAHGLID